MHTDHRQFEHTKCFIRIGRNTRQCWILKLYRATPFQRRSGWINQHAHPQMFHVAHEPWSFLRTQLASGLQYTSFSIDAQDLYVQATLLRQQGFLAQFHPIFRYMGFYRYQEQAHASRTLPNFWI